MKNVQHQRRPISAAVASECYHVSVPHLKREVREGRLTDCRAPGSAANSPLIVDEHEVSARWNAK